MGSVLIIVMNYFHDLAVALLASNILVVYFLGRWLDGQPSAENRVASVFRKLARVSVGAFIFVIVAGAVRAWFFTEIEWNPAVAKGLIPALIVKHIILIAVTTFGVVAHLKYHRKYGKTSS
jgi:uncharacterized membrane protein